MDEEAVLGGLLGSLNKFDTGTKEVQITNIAINLTITGINKGMIPKDVVDYFFEVMKEMKRRKK